MTDHPRFQPSKDDFEAAYREHHGSGLVALVLRLTAPRQRRSPEASNDPMLALDRALLDEEPVQGRWLRVQRSAARAAVAGGLAVLLLFALAQGFSAWRSAGGPVDSRVAKSVGDGAR
jgi:hypothetical protein